MRKWAAQPGLNGLFRRDTQRKMKLGGEEVGGGECEQTIFYVLFKSSNNKKSVLKKSVHRTKTQNSLKSWL